MRSPRNLLANRPKAMVSSAGTMHVQYACGETPFEYLEKYLAAAVEANGPRSSFAA